MLTSRVGRASESRRRCTGPNLRDSDLIAAAILREFDIRPNPHDGRIGHYWRDLSSGPDGLIRMYTRDGCTAIERRPA